MTITIGIVIGYLALLLTLGLFSSRRSRETSEDYFVASHSIGPFMLLMSVFGTTMTAFALVGSTSKAYVEGIGTFGLLASWAALLHALSFYVVGLKLWAIGKRYGFVTQCQYFRDRFESPAIGYLLFPILVGLVIPYLLIGLLGSGRVMAGLTQGAFPELFEGGAIPPWLTAGVICCVVLLYIFFGGLRGAAWANTFQTLFFMLMGLVAFLLIGDKLGGFSAATQAVMEVSPQHLAREGMMKPVKFLTYAFIPLSAAMFPHLFQHWLTARDARAFKLTVVAHPLCIMIVWVPCVLIGIWALGAGVDLPPAKSGAVLGIMVNMLESPIMSGLITAGILAAIMSSLDSQFLCLGTMFTNDIAVRLTGDISDRQKLAMARAFVVSIVIITYLLSLANPVKVFELGVWCFSGFTGLFPLVVASLYWRRVTKAGAFASIAVTAISWLYFFWRSGYGHTEGLVMGAMPVTWIFLMAAAALIVVSLMTQPPGEKTLAKYFPRHG
ncbi:MAG: sodium:solute symporter family protein [Acidobacteriota bacterium]|nr:sodium:solute symporter family protein [Acidobacteriota bacterium]